MTTGEYLEKVSSIPGFLQQVDQIAGDLEPDLADCEHGDALRASVAEFLLEGLYTHNRIGKKQTSGQSTYGL